MLSICVYRFCRYIMLFALLTPSFQHLIQLLIEQRNYVHIATYVFKAEAALESYGSKSDQNSKSSIPNKDSIQIKLEFSTALGYFGQNNYDKAAYGFLKLGHPKNFGDWLGTVSASMTFLLPKPMIDVCI